MSLPLPPPLYFDVDERGHRLKAAFHLRISMRGQRATGKTLSVFLIFTQLGRIGMSKIVD